MACTKLCRDCRPHPIGHGDCKNVPPKDGTTEEKTMRNEMGFEDDDDTESDN